MTQIEMRKETEPSVVDKIYTGRRGKMGGLVGRDDVAARKTSCRRRWGMNASADSGPSNRRGIYVERGGGKARGCPVRCSRYSGG